MLSIYGRLPQNIRLYRQTKLRGESWVCHGFSPATALVVFLLLSLMPVTLIHHAGPRRYTRSCGPRVTPRAEPGAAAATMARQHVSSSKASAIMFVCRDHRTLERSRLAVIGSREITL